MKNNSTVSGFTTEKEKMSNGLIYNPTDPELVACRMKARTLADKFNRTKACELTKRQLLI